MDMGLFMLLFVFIIFFVVTAVFVFLGLPGLMLAIKLRFGNSAVLKVYRDGSTELTAEKNPKTIKFTHKDGTESEVPVGQINHWLRPYQRPLFVAIEGEASTTDLLKRRKTDEFTAEKITALAAIRGAREFQKGIKLASGQLSTNKWLIFLAVVILIAVGLAIYFGYMNHEAITKLASKIL